jgi:TorA maturation chaperone TorD
MDDRLAFSEMAHLMAVLFYDPGEVFAEEGVSLFREYETSVAACDAELYELFTDLESAYRAIDMTGLRVDYAALFVGPGQLLACPYGSVYLEGERRLYGDSTARLEQLYRKAGVRMSGEQVPDHIAVEFEFLHVLLHRLHSTGDSGLAQICAVFSRCYLLPLAIPLAEAMTVHAHTDFYRILAAMLKRFVALIAMQLHGRKGEMGEEAIC